jgi:hypothetical protein
LREYSVCFIGISPFSIFSINILPKILGKVKKATPQSAAFLLNLRALFLHSLLTIPYR